MSDAPLKPELPPIEEEYLKFLRDGGLDMLALFRRVRDPKQRKLIIDFMQAIVGAQTQPNGGS